MNKTRDDITQANQDAHEEFDGGNKRPLKPMKDAEGTQEVNEAADAQFNGDGEGDVLGNHVGGLRGPSD